MTDVAVPSPAPHLHLEIACGPRSGTQIPIRQSQFLIGRSPRCHLRPASPDVGDFHCAVLSEKGQLLVRDLNSTTGTRVNGRQVYGALELRDSDRLQAGPLCFIVRVAPQPIDEPPANPTVADAEAVSSCEVLEVQPWGVLAASVSNAEAGDSATTARTILDRYRRNRRRG